MNPFWLLPSKVTSVAQAERILSVYKAERDASVARQASVAEVLTATLDVLCKAHPDRTEDFATLILAAQAVGHEEGARECLDTMTTDFRRALPFAIKQSMPQ